MAAADRTTTSGRQKADRSLSKPNRTGHATRRYSTQRFGGWVLDYILGTDDSKHVPSGQKRKPEKAKLSKEVSPGVFT